MSGKAVACICLALALCGPAAATDAPDAERKLINKLMQKAEFISVMNVAHPEIFAADNDPNTMQIVFMSDPDAKARVSEDGEVVFLPINISIRDQGYATEEAFRRKAKRILAGQAPPPS